MRHVTALAAGLTIAGVMTFPVQAQSPARSTGRAATAPVVAAAPAKPQPAPEKCLRALDGSCVNPVVAEGARLRAIVVPSVRVSYFGTPAGTIGGAFIPFERLFQDDPVVFGLPTNVFVQPCCITRSK